MFKDKYDWRIIKRIINKNFTFADLSKKFIGVDSSTGNIFCPFHENHDTPAAKMYWDEDKEIWIIHCFGECHRNFTAYDYVDLILCKKYQKYQSPYHFLKTRMPEYQLNWQIERFKKEIAEEDIEYADEKRNYIDNTFIEAGNVTDFIERLYTA